MNDPRGSDSGIRGARLVVSGRVQGVGFRYFVAGAAEECGVRGWVRNLPSGDVEIWAEGSAAALDRLVEKVRVGPRASRVLGLDRVEGDATGRYAGFDVRH